jgi:uncharacterized protein (DUF427 family)
MAAESVWDYPRPPALDPCRSPVRVELGGTVLAASRQALRVLETSHPPTIYFPPQDVRLDRLVPSAQRHSWCEFKGEAEYLDAIGGELPVPAVAWVYRSPSPGYAALRDHVAFYPGRVDGAWFGDERVTAQPGDFYGGWITSHLRGPFKGGAGTLGW